MTVTNEAGAYVLPNLLLGPYKLEAALPGFRTFVQTGIVLQVNDSAVINVVLQVGQVSEQVEVQANAALVDTRSQAVSTVIESTRILELPLNGRNPQELMLLAGGAVQQAPAGGDTFPGRYYLGQGRATQKTAIDNYLSSSQFGVIRNQSTLGPRIMQFAMKYAF